MSDMWPGGPQSPECQQNVAAGALYPPSSVDPEWERKQREYAEKCYAERHYRESLERDDRFRMAALEAAIRVIGHTEDYQLTLRAYRDIFAALKE